MIHIVRETADQLPRYASVPIAFEVREVAEVHSRRAEGPAAFSLIARPVEPYLKDYDRLPGESPVDWPRRFDTTTWAFFAAYEGNERAGGATVAMGPPELDMLEGRTDLALLWDIRVAPARRGLGVGAALLAAVERWARGASARELKVETQNVNVPACRFYERNGFELRVVNRCAYPTLPDELQLLWYRRLDARAHG